MNNQCEIGSINHIITRNYQKALKIFNDAIEKAEKNFGQVEFEFERKDDFYEIKDGYDIVTIKIVKQKIE